jgi:hypothetical protein
MSLDTFYASYVGAALFTSMDDDGDPLDGHYSTEDISLSAAARMRDDCTLFYRANAARWQGRWGYSDEQAGHDFWLTRNRHGAGFWDRGLGQVGKTLTEISHAYGEADLYVGDDGEIYHA